MEFLTETPGQLSAAQREHIALTADGVSKVPVSPRKEVGDVSIQ